MALAADQGSRNCCMGTRIPDPCAHVREPGVIRDRTTRRARPWGAPLKLSAGQVHAPCFRRTTLQATDARVSALWWLPPVSGWRSPWLRGADLFGLFFEPFEDEVGCPGDEVACPSADG